MFRRWFPQLVLASVLACGFTAWGFLTFWTTNQWVYMKTRGAWLENLAELPTHDVGIVPGVLFRNGKPQALLEERLGLALQLYRAGKVRTLLLSGDEEGKGHEVSGMRQWLLERGVPGERMTSDPLGVRTLATMTRALHVFGVRNAIICTQRLFAPRSVFLARAVGIDAVALVPPAVARAVSAQEGTEHLKTALAFVERYALGQTRSASPNTATALLASLLR